MKVLVASHLYPSSVSQTSGSFVHNQVRFLSAHCAVRVVAPVPWFPPLPGCGRWGALGRIRRQEIVDGVEVRRPPYLTLPRRVLFAQVWRSYLAALRQATAELPDLIHAHCAYPDGLAAVHHGRCLGRPVIVTVHGHDVRELPAANPRWHDLVVQALEQAAAVITSSRDVRDRVVQLGIPAGKIHLIPHGVDCRLFRGDFTREPGVQGWRLLYVGRLSRQKGIDVLLEAFAALRGRRDDLQLTLVGGNQIIGTAAEFCRQAVELGLQDSVEFVDEEPWEEIPARLAAADLFVLPSLYDSFSLVLIEAMACGLPIVSTRCGGPNDIVEEGTGILVEVGDAEDLARGIEAVLKGYHRYDRREIRRRAEERYDYGRIAARIRQVYEAVLS